MKSCVLKLDYMCTVFCTDVETYYQFWKYEDRTRADQSNITLHLLNFSYGEWSLEFLYSRTVP